jgi:putative acetyltransferase
MSFDIRPFEPSDAAATLDVFLRAIRVTSAADYSPEQIAAWASGTIDTADWSSRRVQLNTVVATLDDRVVGFTDVDANGYIDMMFVDPVYGRRGVAHQLLGWAIGTAEASGAKTVSAVVSVTARPFFEAHGFVVERQRYSVVRGESLANFAMRRPVRIS